MNTLRLQFLKKQDNYLRILSYIFNGNCNTLPGMVSYVTTVDTFDPYVNEVFQRPKYDENTIRMPIIKMQQITGTENSRNISDFTDEELDTTIKQLSKKNKDKQIEKLILDASEAKKILTDKSLKLLLKHYSKQGKPDIIELVQKYCAKLRPSVLKRNGDFTHYLAKAQCFKGNSEKGLSLLKECYIAYPNIVSVYRLIFRELINDSVMNRSEASLVVFKKYVLEFSLEQDEHYPLVCLWHICWLSDWYSDQMLADELWDTSAQLRLLIVEKLQSLCLSALWSKYNEDAVVRLLQSLLRYKMMEEYTSILQVFFNFKLKNRDMRGCTEILRNCEVLGISLTSDQQSRYIRMLINGQDNLRTHPKLISKDFKLKF